MKVKQERLLKFFIIFCCFLVYGNSFNIKEIENVRISKFVEENQVELLEYLINKDTEAEDHPCEKMTSLVIKSLLNQTTLPTEYTDYYKFGVFSGSYINDWGDYKGCKSMNFSNYFLLNVALKIVNKTAMVNLGICYFKECDISYFTRVKDSLLDYLQKTKNVTIDKNNVTFLDPQEKLDDYRNRMFTGFLVVVGILGLIILLNIFQCYLKSRPNEKAYLIYDIEEDKKSRRSFFENPAYLKPPQSKLSKVLEWFDFSKNTQKLFTINNPNKAMESLRIFDGVRILSTCWVIFGHTNLLTTYAGVKNINYLPTYMKEFKFSLVVSGFYAVDIFFYMSGFMLCYGLKKYLKGNKGKISIIGLSILNRYLRLLPLLLFVIVGMTYIMPYLNDGPLYYSSETLNKSCPSYFWHNLLYFNNLYNYPQGACSGHTWYLANDMQFFIFGLFLMVFCKDFKKVKNSIIILCMISSYVSQIYICSVHKFKFHDVSGNQGGDFFNLMYIKPWNRINAYLIGILFCQAFFKTDTYNNNLTPSNKKTKFMRSINLFLIENDYVCFLLLIFSFILIIFSVFITYFTENYDIPMFWHYIFNAFCKDLFVLGLAIIVHLTFLGKLNSIKNFFSIRIFTIFSRFTYGTYLIHFYILLVYYFSLNTVTYVMFYEMVFLCLGFLIVSLIISYFLTILLESPVINATKAILGGKSDS